MEEKHENFIAAVRTEMLVATKVKMRHLKKVYRNTYNISSIKPVTRKFLEIPLYSRAKQFLPKKCTIKYAACAMFFVIRPFFLLLLFFFNRCLFLTVSLALHYFMFCLSKLIILKTGSLLALAESIYDTDLFP